MLPPNWNVSRIINLIMGSFFILIAINDKAWFMMPIGLYFVAMAVFKFGCSSGACKVEPKEDMTK